MSKRLAMIRYRCENPQNMDYGLYGMRGIKNKLTLENMLTLWERDNASSLHFPVIDRIDPDGNYSMENCRFIERAENRRRRRISIKPPEKKNCLFCNAEYMGIYLHKYCSQVCQRRYCSGYRLVNKTIIRIKKGVTKQ